MTDTSQDHQGGCLCGAVRYTLHSAPDWSAHCHCRSCQKAIGAGFATWSGVKEQNFEVSHGQLTICVTSPGVQRGFCNQCGSSLTYVADGWPGIVSVLSATLDEPSIAIPTAHNYLADKLPWVWLDDELTRRETFADD